MQARTIAVIDDDLRVIASLIWKEGQLASSANRSMEMHSWTCLKVFAKILLRVNLRGAIRASNWPVRRLREVRICTLARNRS
jgi:hypothetical protein